MIRLVADANLSRHFVKACFRLQPNFPLIHLLDFESGRLATTKDPALLEGLREKKLVVVGFDRRTMPVHAGKLTREGLGHAGVILFGRSVSQYDFGKQARLLVAFWKIAEDWDWADRIEYLPHPLVK